MLSQDSLKSHEMAICDLCWSGFFSLVNAFPPQIISQEELLTPNMLWLDSHSLKMIYPSLHHMWSTPWVRFFFSVLVWRKAGNWSRSGLTHHRPGSSIQCSLIMSSSCLPSCLNTLECLSFISFCGYCICPRSNSSHFVQEIIMMKNDFT